MKNEGAAGLSREARRFTAEEMVAYLDMKPIPHEGPWFAPAYKGGTRVGGSDNGYAPRSAYSTIYTLITADRFSAMHRLKNDELWHFYGGTPLELLLLFPDGRSDTVLLGSTLWMSQRPLFCVPGGVWQGARLADSRAGNYALVGNTLCPAFDYSDYEPGFREELITRYPDCGTQITALTREDSIRRP